MSKEIEPNKLMAEQQASDASLEIVHSNSSREKHLEGLSEDEKKIIRLMATIFVKSVLNLSNK